MEYKKIKEIKDNIINISSFNLNYYKLFYSNYFKNKNQKVIVHIETEKFIKLFKNSEVLCEEKEYNRSISKLSKHGTAELLKIYDADIVITTFFDKTDGNIEDFKKLKILKVDKEG